MLSLAIPVALGMDLTQQDLEKILLPLAHKWGLVSKHLGVSVEELKQGDEIEDDILLMKRLINKCHPKLKKRHTLQRILLSCGEISAADRILPAMSVHYPESVAFNLYGGAGGLDHPLHRLPFPSLHIHSPPLLIAANARLETETRNIKASFSQILSDVMSSRSPGELVQILKDCDLIYGTYYSTLTKGCCSTDEITSILKEKLNYLFDYDMLNFVADNTSDKLQLGNIKRYSSEVSHYLKGRLYSTEFGFESFLAVDAEMGINPDNKQQMRKLQCILQQIHITSSHPIELLQVCKCALYPNILLSSFVTVQLCFVTLLTVQVYS